MDLSSQLQQLQQMDQKEESLVVQLQDYIKYAKQCISEMLDELFEEPISPSYLNDMSLFINDKCRYCIQKKDSDNNQMNTNDKGDINEYKRFFCYFVIVINLYGAILFEISKKLLCTDQIHELAASTIDDLPKCILKRFDSMLFGKTHTFVNFPEINKGIHGTTLREAFDTIMSLSPYFRLLFVKSILNTHELSYNNYLDFLDSIEGEGDFERFKESVKHMCGFSEKFINFFSPLNKKSFLILDTLVLLPNLLKEETGLSDDDEKTLDRVMDSLIPDFEYDDQFFRDFTEIGTVYSSIFFPFFIAMKKHIIPNLSTGLQQTLDSFWEIVGIDKKYLENDLDCFSRLLAAEKKRQTSVNKQNKDDKPNDIQDKIQDITKIKQYIKVAARYDVDKLVDSLTKRHELDGEAFGPLISAANNDSADSAKDYLRYFLTGIGDAREFNLRWNKDNMHLHFLIRILLTENLAINENNAVTIFSEKTISKSRPDDISFEESREPIWPRVEAVFNKKNLISSTWRFYKKPDTRERHQTTLQNIARIVFACDVKS